MQVDRFSIRANRRKTAKKCSRFIFIFDETVVHALSLARSGRAMPQSVTGTDVYRERVLDRDSFEFPLAGRREAPLPPARRKRFVVSAGHAQGR